MEQYIGFNLSSSEYTIPILNVREIINMPSITRMPQSPYYIEGITNIRGSVIPIVNLKSLLGVNGYSHPVQNGENGNKVVVVSSGNIIFGMLVDGITGVVNINESDVEFPEKLMGENAGQIKGVAKLEDRLIILLDTRKLIPADDIGMFEDVVVDVKEADDTGRVEILKKVQGMAGEVTVKEFHDAKEYFEKKGMDSSDQRYQIMENMVSFMDAISSQDYDKADNIVKKIAKKGQSEIFNEVGRVTRKLHDSIMTFKESIDPKLRMMAETDMPSAVDRLKFVIEKTEEAANKTMGIVEKHVVSMDSVSAHIRKLNGPIESVDYLRKFRDTLEDDLTEIITTQAFQDITGQTIKKVITLVGDIEEELVRLITTFGVKLEERHEVAIASEKVSQSDVDDLLKGFGF